MPTRRERILTLAVLLTLSLVALGSNTRAQGEPNLRLMGPFLTPPTTVTGSDVGFRILRWEGKIPVGQVVIRVNGVWQAAEIVP